MCAPNLYIFMHNTIALGGRGGSIVSQSGGECTIMEDSEGGGKVTDGIL